MRDIVDYALELLDGQPFISTQRKHTMQITKDTVEARTYTTNGECHELILKPDSRYYIAINGRTNNTKRHLAISEARTFYDNAGYRIGIRPGQ